LPYVTVAQLIRRFARGEVVWLGRWFKRALDENPDGQALLVTAVEHAAWLGLRGWGTASPDGPVPDDLWQRWQARRELTPEAERWPELLAEAGGRDAERTLGEAEALLLDAGAELGMTGAIGGRRARRALADVGRQSAEAGASLAYVLTAPRPTAASEPPPQRAVAAEPMRFQPVKGAVKVATTGNLAECEMLQGMLAAAGIPSSWHRAVMDIPELLAAGDRDIFVPASAAEEARIVLATVE
jgi:nucleotide-binding universal stress UspA family protein